MNKIRWIIPFLNSNLIHLIIINILKWIITTSNKIRPISYKELKIDILNSKEYNFSTIFYLYDASNKRIKQITNRDVLKTHGMIWSIIDMTVIKIKIF